MISVFPQNEQSLGNDTPVLLGSAYWLHQAIPLYRTHPHAVSVKKRNMYIILHCLFADAKMRHKPDLYISFVIATQEMVKVENRCPFGRSTLSFAPKLVVVFTKFVFDVNHLYQFGQGKLKTFYQILAPSYP